MMRSRSVASSITAGRILKIEAVQVFGHFTKIRRTCTGFSD
jgi:hypothetical protein